MNTADLKSFNVEQRISVKKFIEGQGLTFEKGKAYYQLSKKEIIQDYKTVLVRRKSDGEFLAGDTVRKVLNIPKNNNKRVTVASEDVPDFDVFIQSSSYNRVLLPGTCLLYQIGQEAELEEKTKKRMAAPETSVSPAKVARKEGCVVEVVFSFDTTGSMYACLAEVRRGIKDAIKRLKREVPGIRISIIAHGDYCDVRSSYVTKIQNFTEDEAALCKFVESVGATGGGDADECYELVLREVTTKLEWTAGSVRCLVMVGDSNPHEPRYPLNTDNIDWRAECGALLRENIKVYAVQALNRSEATDFYRSLARLTDGFHLRLDQFSSVVNFMMAVCFREEGGDTLNNYEAELRASKSINRELHLLFDTLQGRSSVGGAGDVSYGAARTDGLVPVHPARFQVLHIPHRCSIKEFVQSNSLIFKTGRGFYEFTKPEVISAKKEVVLVDRETGDMFTGREAFSLVGGGGSGRVRPADLEQWRVFVQSTSYNRVLVAGTGFLYEVDTDY